MKEIKCFIVNNTIATPDTHSTPPVFELSEVSKTFALRRDIIPILDDRKNTLHAFKVEGTDALTGNEARLITHVTMSFINLLENVLIEDKALIVREFLNTFNASNDDKVSEFNYNGLLNHGTYRYPDFVTFVIKDLSCLVWLSDASFKLFYPDYDLKLVLPFDNFPLIVQNSKKMLQAISEFDIVEFNDRVDYSNVGYPPTHNKTLNVPYRASWTADLHDCYFGFIIYGEAGNDEFIWKEFLYDYLNEDLGLDPEFIDEHFPSLMQINEFFFIPEWLDYSLPFGVGQGSINSQIMKTWTSSYDIEEFIQAYNTDADATDHFRKNTYFVPAAYNNLTFRVVNGKFSEIDLKDFKKYYSDMITVPSTHGDFSRMSQRTQRFMIMLSYLTPICDAKTVTELFNNITTMVTEFLFTLSTRRGIKYIRIRHGKHTIYMMPRYEYNRIVGER